MQRFVSGAARFSALGIVCACLPVILPALVQAAGEIYNLGTAGGTESDGSSINSSGQVTGTINIPGVGNHGFIHYGSPSSNTSVDIGTLGGTYSFGKSINSSGQIAGDAHLTNDTYTHAMRYIGIPGAGGVMQDLGTLGGANNYSNAMGINDAGDVVGQSYGPADGWFHAFKYTGTPGAGGSMADLGTLGGAYSTATAINNNGQITGVSVIAEGNQHAFRYTGTPGNGGAMQDIGTLGGNYSYANDINDAGEIVGYSYTTDPVTYPLHAFVYKNTGAGEQMLDLGLLSGTQSYATSINNNGIIVGYAYLAGNTVFHPFLYKGTPGIDGAMIDLDVWLDSVNPIEGAKWDLYTAWSISDTGLITGRGAYNDGAGGLSDGPRAYILDASALIPEPSLLGILGVSIVILHRRTRG